MAADDAQRRSALLLPFGRDWRNAATAGRLGGADPNLRGERRGRAFGDTRKGPDQRGFEFAAHVV
jgi:hypothetical protein